MGHGRAGQDMAGHDMASQACRAWHIWQEVITRMSLVLICLFVRLNVNMLDRKQFAAEFF